MLHEPLSRPPVQIWQPRGLRPLKASTEKIAEQVVEAIPAALLVQRDHEQIGPLQVLEHLLAVGPAGDRVADGTAEPLEDGALE